MIVTKSREVPELLQILPRLAERLPNEHPGREKVFAHHRSIRAGFAGERLIDEKLQQMNWQTPAFLIGDLNVASGLSRCQIDTLVLTSHYVLVLEVKNFSGTLVFQGNRYQMTRITREGLEEGFDSPVAQLQRAVKEVEILLRKVGLSMPVYSAIALPYARTIVKGAIADVPIVFAKSLPLFISELPTTHPPVAVKKLQRAAERIASLHLPFYPTDLKKRYDFGVQELRTGVICPACSRTAVKRTIRAHHCHSCGVDILDGYVRALQDWRDFVSRDIRSAECRRFLELSSKDATYHVLKKEAEQVERGLWRIKKPPL